MTIVQHSDGVTPAKAPGRPRAGSADRVLVLLEMLADYPDGLTIAEMSSLLRFPRSSTHGLVHTLAERGYLQAIPDRRGFRLGAKLIQLGMGVVDRLDLRSAARGPLDELAARMRETAFLAVPDAGELVYVDHAASRERDFAVVARLGARRPAHCSSLGKALLAGFDEASLGAWVSNG